MRGRREDKILSTARTNNMMWGRKRREDGELRLFGRIGHVEKRGRETTYEKERRKLR